MAGMTKGDNLTTMKRRKKRIKPKQQYSYLPQDFIFGEILPRLLVKSLLRFKCVCRSWKALISSNKFAKHHLEHTTTTQSNKLVCLDCFEAGYEGYAMVGYEFLETVDMDGPSYQQLDFDKEVTYNVQKSGVAFLGSCNGLVCFCCCDDAGDNYRFHVMNPATGDVEVKHFGFAKIDFKHVYFGFGYVASKDDYKIVVIGVCSDSIKVYLYSVRLRGGWIDIELGLNELNLAPHWVGVPGVLLNETLHWVTTDKRIIGFDLRDEKFKIVLQVPSALEGLPSQEECPSFYLTAIEGCLCAWAEHDVNGMVELWMMKRYGVWTSWTKLADINVQKLTGGGSCEQIVDMFDSRKVLLRTLEDGFGVIDLSSRQRKFVCVTYTRDVVKYVESLVPVSVGSEQVQNDG